MTGHLEVVGEAVHQLARRYNDGRQRQLVGYLKTLTEAELVAYCNGVLSRHGVPPEQPDAQIVAIRRGLCGNPECRNPLPSRTAGTKPRLYCSPQCGNRARYRRKRAAA